jgi:hypothetical protein
MFTIQDKLKLWLSENCLINNELFEIKIEYNDLAVDTTNSKIIEKKYEQKIIINWIEKEKNINSIVEINFMTCSQRAVNCVEIHVIHRGLEEKHFEFYNSFWKEALDSLRYYFNKKWIISDGDLTLTKLTGRSL